jgi:hypothetical protein
LYGRRCAAVQPSLYGRTAVVQQQQQQEQQEEEEEEDFLR